MMAVAGSRQASLLGTAVLFLSLQACAAPPRLPVPTSLPPEPRPAAVASPAQFTSEEKTPPPDPLPATERGSKTNRVSSLPLSVAGRGSGGGVSTPPLEAPEPPAVDAWDRLAHDVDLSLEDYRNYYTWGNMALVGLGIAAAAPLANTTADEHLRRWYQSRVNSSAVSRLAEVGNIGGQLWVVFPLALEGAALLGHAPEGYDTDGGLWEWSNRSLRAIAVGFPPVIAEYFLLGASRPDRGHSGWQPFQDIHGVSGHTFVGAVPFLTAAAMTDNPWIKYPLILGSFFTGWSRFHEDRHYFSQVALGWWMAYVAVRSVNETQDARGRVHITPGVMSEGPGVTLEVRY